MATIRMNDLVVVLPGITGSVLERRGETIWGPTIGAAWRVLRTLGGSLQSLRLDDPTADDGIRATGLMPDIHLVPGLVKIDGYSTLLAMLRTEFDIVDGNVDDERPANLIPYPYDWRLDLRRVAAQLVDFLERRLRLWRDATGNPSAQVILIGHSMGGLVARYAIEVLGAWRSTRLLVTLGTPHRGSPNALGFLANGYKRGFVDLTDVMRSFPSVHQLLPIYSLIEHDGDRHRPAELEIAGVNARLAADGLAFHREIEAAVPIELSDSLQSIYIGEQHASIQNNPAVLNGLRHRIALTQSRGLGQIRGPGPADRERPTIGVDLDDAYLAGEPVVVAATLDPPATGSTDSLQVELTKVGGDGPVRRSMTRVADAEFRLDVGDLDAGAYRVVVADGTGGPERPLPVHDVFVVFD